MNVAVVHHLVDLPGWEAIAGRHVDLLLESGLLDAANEVHLLGHYDERSFEPLRRRLAGHANVRWRFDGTVLPQDMEVPSIGFVRDLAAASDEEFALCYLHLKGITRLGDEPVQDWARFLEYSIVERWRDCLERLEAGYDTCGVNFRPRPWPHYAGNFWWARASYLRTLLRLRRPSEVGFVCQVPRQEQGPRFDAEAWIGSGSGRHWVLHQSPVLDSPSFHYRKRYPPEAYRDRVTAGVSFATRGGRLTFPSRIRWWFERRVRRQAARLLPRPGS